MENLDLFIGSIISFFLLLCESSALAADPALTYHGRLLTAAGVPVTGLVNFKIQIKSPGTEDCLLWEETQSQTLDSGVFVLALNGSSSTRADGGVHSFTDVFSNRQTFNVGAAKCAVGYASFNPGSADTRVLKVSFNDGTFSGWEDAPSQAINYAPKAIDALRVSGVPIESLLRFSESDGTLVNTSPLNNAQYTELLALLAGTSDKYLKSSATEGVTLPVLASQPTLTAGKLWYEGGSIKYYDASSAQVKTLGTSSAGVATPGTYKSVTVDTYGRVISGTNPTTVADYGITDAVKNGGQTGAVTIGSSDANAVSLVTNNTSKMTVLSNGNVGIGTTNPNTPFHIVDPSDSATIAKFSRVGGSSFLASDIGFQIIPTGHFTASASSFAMVKAISQLWLRGGSNIYFQRSSDNADLMFINTASGNIGIGTSTPSAKLEVNGSSTIDGQNLTNQYTLTLKNIGAGQGGLVISRSTGFVTYGNNLDHNQLTAIGTDNKGLIYSQRGSLGGGEYAAHSFRGDANTSLGFKSIVDAKAGAAGISLFQGRQSDNSLVFDVDYDGKGYFAGNVGIGTINPTSPLHVSTTATSGNIANFVSTGAGGGGCSIAWDGVSCSSDIRLKENVVSADSAILLDSLLKVRPVHFSWKKDEGHENQTGFIAQELEKIFPEFVKTNEDGYKQVNYAHFASALTSGVQELFKKLQLHDRRIASIENENANLKEKVIEFEAFKSEICRKDPSYSFCKK